jgi:uncharacterized membrane protein YoaK (UPF0700 family)
MVRYDRRIKLLAIGLSALAGIVDATGFLQLGGFFVSFMTGNTTRLGVGLAQDLADAGTAMALVAGFVLGVMLGIATGMLAPRRRAMAVLLLVAALLAVAAAAADAGLAPLAVAAMTLAMGAENAVFEQDGEIRIGLTYMTGTLVKLGQHLTRALLGGPPWAWASHLLLWLGLAAGAMIGALSYRIIGLNDLWAAALAAVLFAAIAGRLLPDQSGAQA